jgi:hypothetical protein
VRELHGPERESYVTTTLSSRRRYSTHGPQAVAFRAALRHHLIAEESVAGASTIELEHLPGGFAR